MAVPIPTNPYLEGLTKLFELSQTVIKLYEDAKAQAKADGKLTDADENELHAKEDAAMSSHPWSK